MSPSIFSFNPFDIHNSNHFLVYSLSRYISLFVVIQDFISLSSFAFALYSIFFFYLRQISLLRAVISFPIEWIICGRV